MSSSEEQMGAGALQKGSASSELSTLDKIRRRMGGHQVPPALPPSGGGGDGGGGDEEDGMLRMSFLEHLEELRSRIFKALAGIAVAFIASLTFSSQLWDFVCKPAVGALTLLK